MLPAYSEEIGVPMDGRHLFFNPGEVPFCPPGVLWYDPDGPDAAVYVRVAQRAGQTSWPYRWQRDGAPAG